MAGERTKSAPFLLASPFAVLLLWTMELLAGGTSYDARVSLLSLGLASLLSLFLASLSLRGAGWRRVSSFLPLLIFVLEAAAFLALLLEAGFSYGVRIDGGFFLVGKGIRLVGTGQAVPYPGGEEWMYGKDLYSYPFRFDVPVAFLILLVLLVLYRKEAKAWLLRFLRMDGEGLLALLLILPFALVSLSRLLGAFYLPAEGYLRVLFMGFLLEALLFFLALWRGQAAPSLIALALALAFLEEHMRQGSSIPSFQDALFLLHGFGSLQGEWYRYVGTGEVPFSLFADSWVLESSKNMGILSWELLWTPAAALLSLPLLLFYPEERKRFLLPRRF